MNIYEMYGRLAEERGAERTAHLRTIQLLRDITSGAVAIGDVHVVGDSWTITASPASPMVTPLKVV